jgi:hypothetical protein
MSGLTGAYNTYNVLYILLDNIGKGADFLLITDPVNNEYAYTFSLPTIPQQIL